MPPEEICLASKSSTKSYVCSLTDIEKGAVSIDATFSPHLCVGFLFLILFPASAAAASSTASSAASLSHTTLSPTVFHTQLCHPPSFTHTQLCHTQLCHTSSFTHNFVTHHLSHTTLSPTICHTHTQLCHPPSVTHYFVTHTQLCHPSFTHNFVTHHLSQLCHTPSFTHNFVTHLSHTTLSHTIFHNFVTNHLSHTALSSIFHITAAFAWQAWHLETSTFVLRGRRGTYGTGLTLVARWDWSPVAALCVAGVALGDIHLRFTWQAWHLETSTFVLRGRCGTYGTGLALVARLGWDHFAWHSWHLATSTFVSRGRRGTWRHPPSFCVAGVALMALGWLWWRAWAGIGRR